MKDTLSVISGIVLVAGFVPYIIAILRKKTKPAKATWIIWACLDTIIFAGMLAEKTLNGQIIGAVIGIWVIVGLAIYYGEPGWTRVDKFCLGGSVLGIALWIIFSNPVLGIVTSVAVLVLGSVPTFVSAWKDPGREDRLAWTLYWISCIFALLAIEDWTWASAAQPLSYTIIDCTMVFILFVYPGFIRK